MLAEYWNMKKNARAARLIRHTMAVLLVVLGCVAFGQGRANPASMRAEAEKMMQRADIDRTSGRSASATGWFNEARNILSDLAGQFPDYEPALVQERLSYCRQQLSAMEADFDQDFSGPDAEPGDDRLGAILDMIESQEDAQQSAQATASASATRDPAPPSMDVLDFDEPMPIAARGRRYSRTEPVPPPASEAAPVTPSVDARAQSAEMRTLRRQLAETEKTLNKTRAEMENLKNRSGEQAQTSEEMNRMRGAVTRLEKELEQAAKREEHLKTELANARSAGASAIDWDAPVPVSTGGTPATDPASTVDKRRLQSLEQAVAQLERERDRAQQQAQSLQDELARARNALQDNTQTESQAGRREQARVAALERENGQLRSTIALTQEQLREAQRQLEANREHKSVLSEEIESTDSRWSQEVLQLKQELNREKAQTIELREIVANLRQSLRESEGSRTELLRSVQERSQALSQTESGHAAMAEEMRARLAESMHEVAQLKAANLDLGETISRLRSEGRAQETRLDKLQRDYLEIANSSAAIANENIALKTRQREMDAKMSELREGNKAIADYRRRLDEAQSTIGTLQGRLVFTEDQHADTKSQLAARERQLAEMNALKEELLGSRQEKGELAKYQKEMQDTINKLNVEVLDMKAALAQSARNREELEHAMEKARSDAQLAQSMISSLQLRLVDSQESLASAQQRAEQAERHAAESQRDAETQIRQAQQEMLAERAARSELKKRMDMLALDQVDWAHERERLEDSIRELRADKMDMEVELAKMAAEKTNAERLSVRLREDYSKVAGQLADQEEKYQAALSRHNAEMQESSRRAAQLERQVQAKGLLAEEREQLEQKAREFETQWRQATTRHREEVASLQAEINREKQQAETSATRAGALQKQIDQISTDSALQGAQVRQVEQEREALERKLDEQERAHHQALLQARRDEADQREAVIRLQNEQRTLQAHIKSLQDEQLAFRAGMMETDREKRALEQEVNQSDEAWRSKLAEALQEAQSLRDQLALRDRRQDSSLVEFQQMQKKNDELAAEVRRLGAQLADVERARNELQELVSRQQQAENETFIRQQSQIAQLDERNQQWASTADTLRKQISEMHNQTAELTKQLHAEQAQGKTIQKRLDAANAQVATLAESQQEASSLKQELQGIQALHATLQAENRTLENSKESLENLQRDYREIERQINELNEQNKSLAAQLAGERSIKEQVQTELANSHADAAAAKEQADRYRQQISDMQVKLVELTESNELNVKLVEQMHADMEGAQENDARLVEAEQWRDELAGQVKRLTAEVEEKTARLDEINERLMELEAENKEMNGYRSDLEKQIQTLTSAKESGQSELAEALDKYRQIKEEKDNLDMQLGSLKREQQAAMANLDQTEKENESLKERIQVLTRDLNQATETLESLANF